MMLYKHPRVLGSSLDLLREKHAFVVDEWGRKPEEIEIFPQVLTYSLDYLRARAGFLLANGKADQHHLHRILRTADHLFAKNLSGGRTAQEYQAFAAAIAGTSTRAAEGSVAAGADGSPAKPLSELVEEAQSGKWQALVSAGDKHLARRLAEVTQDMEQAQAIEDMRQTLDELLGRGASASGAQTLVAGADVAAADAAAGDAQSQSTQDSVPEADVEQVSSR